VRAFTRMCVWGQSVYYRMYMYVIFMNDNALIQRGERDSHSALDHRTRINNGGEGG